MKKLFLCMVLVAGVGLTACDDGESQNETVVCDPSTCNNGKHCDKGECVADTVSCDASTCNNGKHCDKGECVDDAVGGDDPCQNVKCTEGVCSEGVCVTDAMKKLAADTICDPETFVDFCDGSTVVYCDNAAGTVMRGNCNEGCAVYVDTARGRAVQKAGCIDGGACTTLNELKSECQYDKAEQVAGVFVTACQKTTRNTLRYISVDGYYCEGVCNATNDACEALENTCDPYRYKPSCDGDILTTCFLTSNLTPVLRDEYCKGACTTVDGVAMCGMAECTEEGTRRSFCGSFDSTSDEDAIDTVCVKDDQGKRYQVRTGQHDYCPNGCNSATGECMP